MLKYHRAWVTLPPVAAPKILELAKTLEALACPDRLKIVAYLLAQEGPSCGDVAQALGMSQSALSYHLRILEGAGLLERWRQGRTRCLRLRRPARDLLPPKVLKQLQKEATPWKSKSTK